jgi:hypothetical protein
MDFPAKFYAALLDDDGIGGGPMLEETTGFKTLDEINARQVDLCKYGVRSWAVECRVLSLTEVRPKPVSAAELVEAAQKIADSRSQGQEFACIQKLRRFLREYDEKLKPASVPLEQPENSEEGASTKRPRHGQAWYREDGLRVNVMVLSDEICREAGMPSDSLYASPGGAYPEDDGWWYELDGTVEGISSSRPELNLKTLIK